MAQFVNYTGGGTAVTPQSAVAAYNTANGSGASGLPAYQPVPDSASYLALVNALQGQPTLAPFLPTATPTAVAGTPTPAVAGASAGDHSVVGMGGYGANNVPGTPDANAPWIDDNTPFNSQGFMQALAARHAAGLLPVGPPSTNPLGNPYGGAGSPLNRLQWTGFTQTRNPTNPFSGQVGGREPYTGANPAPAGWPTNPAAAAGSVPVGGPVPPASSSPSTWSYGDQLLGHGGTTNPTPVVPNNPVSVSPSLPQSPWSALANHLRRTNTPEPNADLQPINQ